jgi:hypothetical protein
MDKKRIYIFQTIAGEMIVGKFESYDEKQVVLYRPARVLVVDVAGGKTNVAIVPIALSTFSESEFFTFPYAGMSVYPELASDKVTTQYNVQYGSNLILPQNTNKIIV